MATGDGASLELQGWLYGVFSNWAPLQELLGTPARVYDRVPADVVFPYVAIGEAEENADDVECIDGSEHFLTCHVWTRDQGQQGKVEAKRIGTAMNAAIAAAVAAAPDLATHRLQVFARGSARYFDDQDGLTVHGVLIYRALTEPKT